MSIRLKAELTGPRVVGVEGFLVALRTYGRSFCIYCPSEEDNLLWSLLPGLFVSNVGPGCVSTTASSAPALNILAFAVLCPYFGTRRLKGAIRGYDEYLTTRLPMAQALYKSFVQQHFVTPR